MAKAPTPITALHRTGRSRACMTASQIQAYLLARETLRRVRLAASQSMALPQEKLR